MEAQTKFHVNIYSSIGPGIILECASGIIYTRQTGGIYINSPKIEGSYIPLDYDQERLNRLGISDLNEKLRSLFDFKSKYQGRSHELYQETADVIDEILEKLTVGSPLTISRQRKEGGSVSTHSVLKVDRTKLGQSQEAWVHITIKRDDNVDFKGVFTWENSD